MSAPDPASRLLVDIGNSRLKWKLERRGRLGPEEGCCPVSALRESMERAWSGLEPPAAVLVSNVAGPVPKAIVEEWVRAHWCCPLRFITTGASDYGVRIAYRDPTKLGVDRWLALVALRHYYSPPACAVDCGTAITLDVIDASGRHRGGLILPGLALMKRALLKGTRGITEHGDECDGYLGRSTVAGIEKAAVLAAAGMVEKVMKTLNCEEKNPHALIFTGGDAARVAAQVDVPVLVDPDLVLKGLGMIR